MDNYSIKIIMEEENIDTSGFYKNYNGQILYGPTAILNKNFELLREKKDEYEYPVDGWYWFDSEQEAKQFFKI